MIRYDYIYLLTRWFIYFFCFYRVRLNIYYIQLWGRNSFTLYWGVKNLRPTHILKGGFVVSSSSDPLWWSPSSNGSYRLTVQLLCMGSMYTLLPCNIDVRKGVFGHWDQISTLLVVCLGSLPLHVLSTGPFLSVSLHFWYVVLIHL